MEKRRLHGKSIKTAYVIIIAACIGLTNICTNFLRVQKYARSIFRLSTAPMLICGGIYLFTDYYFEKNGYNKTTKMFIAAICLLVGLLIFMFYIGPIFNNEVHNTFIPDTKHSEEFMRNVALFYTVMMHVTNIAITAVGVVNSVYYERFHAEKFLKSDKQSG